MNRRIRTVAFVALACFALLGLQLANLQVREAPALRNTYENKALTSNGDPFEQDRGDILSSDGVVLADSYRTKDGYGYLRHYPEGSLFAGITGYWDVTASAAPYGLDSITGQYNHFLIPHTPSITNLQSILTQRSGTDSLVTTISVSLQKVAQEALGSYDGAVVAIDPQNGNILAMYSNPTYNPNELSQPNAKAANAYYNSLSPSSGTSPLINGAIGAALPARFDVQGHHDRDDLRPRSIARIDQNPLRVVDISLPDTNLLLPQLRRRVVRRRIWRTTSPFRATPPTRRSD